MCLSPSVVKLSRHAKFRVEGDYVLLCHCKYLQDYRLPLMYVQLLERLRIGVDSTEELPVGEQDVVDDLRATQLLAETDDVVGEGARILSAGVWDRRAFQEDQ